jgi:hypothetical protein
MPYNFDQIQEVVFNNKLDKNPESIEIKTKEKTTKYWNKILASIPTLVGSIVVSASASANTFGPQIAKSSIQERENPTCNVVQKWENEKKFKEGLGFLDLNQISDTGSTDFLENQVNFEKKLDQLRQSNFKFGENTLLQSLDNGRFNPKTELDYFVVYFKNKEEAWQKIIKEATGNNKISEQTKSRIIQYLDSDVKPSFETYYDFLQKEINKIKQRRAIIDLERGVFDSIINSQNQLEAVIKVKDIYNKFYAKTNSSISKLEDFETNVVPAVNQFFVIKNRLKAKYTKIYSIPEKNQTRIGGKIPQAQATLFEVFVNSAINQNADKNTTTNDLSEKVITIIGNSGLYKSASSVASVEYVGQNISQDIANFVNGKDFLLTSLVRRPLEGQDNKSVLDVSILEYINSPQFASLNFDTTGDEKGITEYQMEIIRNSRSPQRHDTRTSQEQDTSYYKRNQNLVQKFENVQARINQDLLNQKENTKELGTISTNQLVTILNKKTGLESAEGRIGVFLEIIKLTDPQLIFQDDDLNKIFDTFLRQYNKITQTPDSELKPEDLVEFKKDIDNELQIIRKQRLRIVNNTNEFGVLDCEYQLKKLKDSSYEITTEHLTQIFDANKKTNDDSPKKLRRKNILSIIKLITPDLNITQDKIDRIGIVYNSTTKGVVNKTEATKQLEQIQTEITSEKEIENSQRNKEFWEKIRNAGLLVGAGFGAVKYRKFVREGRADLGIRQDVENSVEKRHNEQMEGVVNRSERFRNPKLTKQGKNTALNGLGNPEELTSELLETLIQHFLDYNAESIGLISDSMKESILGLNKEQIESKIEEIARLLTIDSESILIHNKNTLNIELAKFNSSIKKTAEDVQRLIAEVGGFTRQVQQNLFDNLQRETGANTIALITQNKDIIKVFVNGIDCIMQEYIDTQGELREDKKLELLGKINRLQTSINSAIMIIPELEQEGGDQEIKGIKKDDYTLGIKVIGELLNSDIIQSIIRKPKTTNQLPEPRINTQNNNPIPKSSIKNPIKSFLGKFFGGNKK